MAAATQEQRQKAALLVAKNKLSAEKIAAEVFVSPRTIVAWKAQPEFQKLVADARDAWRAKARTGGPADPDRRNLDYKNLRTRVWNAILARGADEKNAHVPGHDTGMVAVKFKKETSISCDGELMTELVPEYELDTGAVTCLLSIDRQAAEDSGQWKTKREITVAGPDDGPIQIENVSALTDDELRTLIALARKLNSAAPGGGAQPPKPQPHVEPLSICGPDPEGPVPETP